MRRSLYILLSAMAMASAFSFAPKRAPADSAFQTDAEGKMPFPDDYRDWVFLSSGLGMSYTPSAQENSQPSFQNVFVSPAAYRAFRASGAWPSGTVFVLEIRASSNRGSINQAGRFQADLIAIETHVKKRDGEWAFYGFGAGRQPAGMMPKSANCYSCHEQHGAVDTTFVQFYPTLVPVAQEKGTYKEGH